MGNLDKVIGVALPLGTVGLGLIFIDQLKAIPEVAVIVVGYVLIVAGAIAAFNAVSK